MLEIPVRADEDRDARGLGGRDQRPDIIVRVQPGHVFAHQAPDFPGLGHEVTLRIGDQDRGHHLVRLEGGGVGGHGGAGGRGEGDVAQGRDAEPSRASIDQQVVASTIGVVVWVHRKCPVGAHRFFRSRGREHRVHVTNATADLVAQGHAAQGGGRQGAVVAALGQRLVGGAGQRVSADRSVSLNKIRPSATLSGVVGMPCVSGGVCGSAPGAQALTRVGRGAGSLVCAVGSGRETALRPPRVRPCRWWPALVRRSGPGLIGSPP